MLLCFDVPADQKVSVVEDMRNTPQDCLPLFGQRLCSLCPTNAMMLDAGAKIVEAWASTSFATIDESERAHFSLRALASSQTRGRSPTVVGNQSLCRQVHASHVASKGEPVDALKALDASASDGQTSKKHRKARGNPRMSHRNAQRHAFKTVFAPRRPLTPEELQRCDAMVDREWQQIAQDPVQLEAWRSLHFAQNLKRTLLPLADAKDADEGERFRPLWGLSEEPSHIVPLPMLHEHGAARPVPRDKSRKVWQDDDLNVQEPVPERMSQIHTDWAGKVDGCFGTRKTYARTTSWSARRGNCTQR